MHKLNDWKSRKNGWQFKRVKRRRLLQSRVRGSLKYFSIGILLVLFSCSSKKQFSAKPALSEIEQEKVTRTFIQATSAKIKENFPEAKRLFLEAVEKDEKVSASYYHIADIYQMELMYDSALHFAKLALALEPKNKWYRELGADLFWRNRERSTSIKMYESLLQEFPGTRLYYKRLEDFYRRENNFNAMVNLVQKEMKYFGSNTARLTKLSNLYLSKGDSDKAKELWVEELNKNPKNAIAYVRLGRIYFLNKDQDQLEKNYKKAYETLPYNKEVGSSYAEHILVFKPIDEIKSFLSDSNHSVEVIRHLYNKAISKEQRLEIAVFLIEKGVATEEMIINHGMYLAGSKRYGEAVKMFSKVEDQLNTEEELYFYFISLLDTGEIVSAERLLDKIIEQYPFSNKLNGYKKKLKDAENTK